MKLIICKNCNTSFTPSEKEKKCDCQCTTGRIINNVVHYSGDSAEAVDLLPAFMNNMILQYWDDKAVKEDYKKTKKHLQDQDRVFYTNVIEYLNEKAGANYIAKFPSSNSVLILSRRDELKCTIDDFRRVIDNKVISWKGNPTMEVYLRPKTLFNKTNFINYLGEGNARQQKTTGKSFEQFGDALHEAKGNLLTRSDKKG